MVEESFVLLVLQIGRDDCAEKFRVLLLQEEIQLVAGILGVEPLFFLGSEVGPARDKFDSVNVALPASVEAGVGLGDLS